MHLFYQTYPINIVRRMFLPHTNLMPHIITETADLLVINKPAGLIVHSDGRTVEPSLADWIGQRYPELVHVGAPWVSPQGESVPIYGLVHRLDRTTSGIIVAAKSQEMFDYLKNEFKERRVEKVYRAYVYGHMEADEGRIVAEIMRSSGTKKGWYAQECGEDNKRAAVTNWKVLKQITDPMSGESASYLELRPETGRTHQIRVHLASIGHSIVGDHLYAGNMKPILGFTRPALHAYQISFNTNDTRETFTAPLPNDFVGAELSDQS